MSSHSATKLVWDALHAAERIRRFIEGKTETDYFVDELLRAAVERQFEIMGEALVRLQKIVPGVAASVPDLREIIGFRNRLIHGYDTIDDRIVWTAAIEDLARVIAALNAVLQSLPPM
jgi:uncharacterized protein with HEPN domain